jgi:ATP-dependent DNA helicase RecG
VEGFLKLNLDDLLNQVSSGEDSTRQFKADVRNAESLASEMSAFANSEGGTIYLGVADDGSTPGLSKTDVGRVNQLISNAASHLVKSPLTVRTENIALQNGRVVIVLTVPKGLDKPYFDKNGVIWLKTGADKRRVNSKEELRRLFQITDQFHADELPTKAGIDKLDKLRFRDFLRDVYKQDYPDGMEELARLLQNMNLATDDGMLNLAGLLMFAERPELIKPQFVVKAIRYPSNRIHATDYVDTEDFAGPLPKIFDDAIAFVMRNLHKVQAGRGVNAPGLPEIPETVFEELLVNALVHRDYLVSAPVRLFIFDNRIEIISPGHLPNNLTVEKIRTGNSNIRNPILVSYVAKGLLPYHGLGSGIKRALAEWPEIDFADDRDGCLFTATVHRKPVEELESVNIASKSSPKSDTMSGKRRESVGKDSECLS